MILNYKLECMIRTGGLETIVLQKIIQLHSYNICNDNNAFVN